MHALAAFTRSRACVVENARRAFGGSAFDRVDLRLAAEREGSESFVTRRNLQRATNE
jgi:hypothetical protein